MKYPVKATKSFQQSLKQIVSTWRDIYHLPSDQITGYTHLIYERTQQLSDMPHLGQHVNDLPGYPLIKYSTRKLVVNKAYSIFYRVINGQVYLGRIFSNRRNPKYLNY